MNQTTLLSRGQHKLVMFLLFATILIVSSLLTPVANADTGNSKYPYGFSSEFTVMNNGDVRVKESFFHWLPSQGSSKWLLLALPNGTETPDGQHIDFEYSDITVSPHAELEDEEVALSVFTENFEDSGVIDIYVEQDSDVKAQPFYYTLEYTINQPLHLEEDGSSTFIYRVGPQWSVEQVAEEENIDGTLLVMASLSVENKEPHMLQILEFNCHPDGHIEDYECPLGTNEDSSAITMYSQNSFLLEVSFVPDTFPASEKFYDAYPLPSPSPLTDEEKAEYEESQLNKEEAKTSESDLSDRDAAIIGAIFLIVMTLIVAGTVLVIVFLIRKSKPTNDSSIQ